MPTYISKQGLEDLKTEIQTRRTKDRKQIAEDISQAKELGDLSENFEYQDAKERQGLNESRIVQLEGMIMDAVVVEQSSGNTEISLGATFVVVANGAKKTYSMVGSTEADPLAGKISNEAPIGQAFFGAREGDKVVVDAPSGEIEYEILSIE
jgi:transcription elongation factor GreA